MPPRSVAIARRAGSSISARDQTPAPQLLQTFQSHIEDMRSLIYCKICFRPLYEPFTLGCGHTYCYSCLSEWFNNGGDLRHTRKSCPDCRAAVKTSPSPNYLLRELIHMFVSRVELLSEGDSVEEHDEAKRIEAVAIERDRSGPIGVAGLFKGAFPTRPPFPSAIHDFEDGVERCPVCAWELEGGSCIHCGYETQEDDMDSYSDDSMETRDYLETQRDVDHDVDVEADYDEFDGPLDENYDHAIGQETLPPHPFPVRFNSAWDDDLDPEYDSADDNSTITGEGYNHPRNHPHQNFQHTDPNGPVEDYTDYDDDMDGDDEETSSMVDFISRDGSIEGDAENDNGSISSFHRHAMLAGDMSESDQESASSVSQQTRSETSDASSESDESESSDPASDTPEPQHNNNHAAMNAAGARRTRRVINDSSDESNDVSDDGDDASVQEVSPPQTTRARQTRHQSHQEHRSKRGRPRRSRGQEA